MHRSGGLPVAVDVMGSDLGPEILVRGALNAGLPVTLVGKRPPIEAVIKQRAPGLLGEISVLEATEWVEMDEDPVLALKRKPDNATRKAFGLAQAQRACAMVSAANTGALVATSALDGACLPGVSRPAIATSIPRLNRAPLVLLDSGANTKCSSEQLAQFAVLGSVYSRVRFGISAPRVALLANGIEPSKGNQLTHQAFERLRNALKMNFIGYIEGLHLTGDLADVVVCDGFVGNITLKTLEGCANFVYESLRQGAAKDWISRLGWQLSRRALEKTFADTLSPDAQGGAPLLGLEYIALACHGSADENAISNAVRLARTLADSDLVRQSKTALLDF